VPYGRPVEGEGEQEEEEREEGGGRGRKRRGRKKEEEREGGGGRGGRCEANIASILAVAVIPSFIAGPRFIAAKVSPTF
jgi:hypothetical protein